MSTSDCLVLAIEDSIIYMKVFVIFDILKGKFFICGKKVTSVEYEWVPFSFYCEKENVLMNFINLVMDDSVNIYLYNLNNLPISCDEISFDLLENSKHESCEIVKYINEDECYNMTVLDCLELLKQIRND